MSISACLIARGVTVLAEYTATGINFSVIARRLLEQIPSSPDSKKSYSYEGQNFNYLVESGITYICMSKAESGLRIPYAFLFDISGRFRATYGERVNTAGNMAMNDTFSRVLKDRLEFFNNDKNADKISKVKGEIEDAKKIMVQNIDKVLERGEKIEMLVSKTEDLNQHTQTFRKKSKELKRKMWWQNCKLCCILLFIVAIVLAVVTLVILWKVGVFKPHPHHTTNSTTTATTGDLSSSGDLTTSFITTSKLTTSFMTTGKVTSGAVTSSAITSSPLTTAPVTSAALTTSPVTSAEMTTGEVTSADLTTSPLTTSPETTGELTTAPLTTAPLTTGESTTGESTTGESTTGADSNSTEVTTGLAQNLQKFLELTRNRVRDV